MKHVASILWKRNPDEIFVDNKYSRKHAWRFDGGLEVPASSSPHVVRLPFSDASAVDPEEAFVASIASCHMLTFLFIAASQTFVIERYEDEAEGEMSKNAEGEMFVSKVTLKPRIHFSGDQVPSPEKIMDMHHLAHKQCFIANSIITKVMVNPQ
jgi:organic hydroperoxide reductase OsmC/OhrA